MKLLPSQIDEASLLRLSGEAVALLKSRDFRSVADRFGYALACGRDLASALEQDLGSCITEHRDSTERGPTLLPSASVKYFSQNDSGLVAVVEFFNVTSESCPILVELIVTLLGSDKHITLKQVSLVRA